MSFSNASTQSRIGDPYAMALKNLLDVNSVRFDPSVYNKSGLMTTDPQTFVKAGGGYDQPWTRDASVNTWNAASALDPQVAANTLWSVVTRQADGQLVLVQDNQWWDQVVWMTSAWNHYLVTGDKTFLANAYQTAANTLDLRQSKNFNSAYGLFQGPAFFNDGIAGYPAPPADSTESKGSFVGSYSATDTMMTLSTNSLYYEAYRSSALMAQALGRPAAEAAGLNSKADALKQQINQRFWIAAKGTYGYFLHNGDGQAAGSLDQSEEGAGLSFAVLFGIASPLQAQSVLRTAHVQPHGITDVYPNFSRYSDARPGRHNVIVWPMVQGFWTDAAGSIGDTGRLTSEIENLAALATSWGQFAEIYNALTGAVDGGWQTGGHWSAAPDQTWSASAYLHMIDHDVFGMTFTSDGLEFRPTLPSGWGDATLSNVAYRGATLTVRLHGAGNTISSFAVDGTASVDYGVSPRLTGSHTVDITLSNSGSGPVLGSGWQCMDVRDASSADGAAVQLWKCNGTPAQQWKVDATGQTVRALGKCLDAASGGTADGTAIQLWTCNGTGAQVWQPQSNGALRNPQSGKCLDVPNSSADWGTRLQLFDCNGTAAQQWALPS
ncbi:ricin-type beta-trefoil lectin domain protein [Streptomyces sp. NPDC046985]|uniref:ricin-type beta-trefoil lectin domain protein n=1 Tax=Streptomyces sp. NPDC046985 TaxID=3155377 RepID=UPI003404B928